MSPHQKVLECVVRARAAAEVLYSLDPVNWFSERAYEEAERKLKSAQRALNAAIREYREKVYREY
jgi:hypothetical protein